MPEVPGVYRFVLCRVGTNGEQFDNQFALTIRFFDDVAAKAHVTELETIQSGRFVVIEVTCENRSVWKPERSKPIRNDCIEDVINF